MENIFDSGNTESASEGVSSSPVATDFKALREKIFGAPKGKPAKVKKAQNIEEASTGEDDLKKLFAGENWEEVSALYFNARYAMTGYDGFMLSKDQKAILGVTLGASMKMLLKIDPGYIALTVFLANYAGIIGEKELEFNHAKKLRAREDARKTA